MEIVHSLTIILVILSLWGTILNLKYNYKGFYLWAITDLLWGFYNLKIGAFWEAILMFIYTGLALWGLYEWRYKNKNKKEDLKWKHKL